MKNDDGHPRPIPGTGAAHRLSPVERLLGGGSHRRYQRHDNEGQQEDYEQHRPEQESEDQEEGEGDLRLAAQTRYQTFDRCPHRILTGQESPNAFQPRFHAGTTVCDRLDERVHPLLDLPRQRFPAVSHRVQKPVNLGLYPLHDGLDRRPNPAARGVGRAAAFGR